MKLRCHYSRTLIGLLFVVLPVAGATEDMVDIYESISDAEIGPVFLTPVQREWLDKRRQLPPVNPVSNSTGEPAEAMHAAKKAAGYIVSSSGKRSEWTDGEFVESALANTAQIVFPDEVELLRHETDVDAGGVDDGDDEKDD